MPYTGMHDAARVRPALTHKPDEAGQGKGAAPPGSQAGAIDLHALDYELPTELIAQHPAPRREDARLLVVRRESGELLDRRITDLPGFLAPADLLVVNDSKVVPARFFARRRTGGRVEALFLRETAPGSWVIMARSSSRLKPGDRIGAPARDGSIVPLTLQEHLADGTWLVGLDVLQPAEAVLETIGFTPLPPYIHRGPEGVSAADRERYQTVYARSAGSVAAPTAGLHLTDALLAQVRAMGVEISAVTLHVGIGTFRPIRADHLDDHRMHAEEYDLGDACAAAIAACRERRGRVVSVGTTAARVLESQRLDGSAAGLVSAGRGFTDIFIRPPYRFGVVDALLTNFHLPRSTLLAMVMALAGVELIQSTYRHAVAERYRFFSFGDAMLIV